MVRMILLFFLKSLLCLIKNGNKWIATKVIKSGNKVLKTNRLFFNALNTKK